MEKLKGVEHIRNYMAYLAAREAYMRAAKLKNDLEEKKIEKMGTYRSRLAQIKAASAQMDEILGSGMETWQMINFTIWQYYHGRNQS